MRPLAELALVLLFGALLFALGYLVGTGRGMELIRRDAVAEGYAVRTPEGGIRWKSSEELERRPAKRTREPKE